MIEIDLKAELRRFLALRESFGIPIVQTKPLLEKFVEYLILHSPVQAITAQRVLDWACLPHYSSSTQHVRLSTARTFLKHLKVIIPEVAIPRINSIAASRRPEPFVFSEKQLAELLLVAGKLGSRKTMEPLTLQTMLGLMSCTGLRPGEVMRLKSAQVLLDDVSPRLLILRTKFGKTRWVPLHGTTVKQLRLYLQSRQSLPTARISSDSLFISKKGKPINRITFHRIFQHTISQTDIRARKGQSRPTLQSLRHSFAVHRLRHWYEAGEDIRALLPNLSVYLGHLDPAQTYWYLSCTPELMVAAAQRFESYAEGRTSNEEKF